MSLGHRVDSRTFRSANTRSPFIDMVGGAFGCSVGYLALSTFANAVPSLGGLPILQMPPQVVVETLVAAALIGILSALIPARGAAQESIVETLRALV
jgi:ABC-type antimicrobial peptide transport system permease subunit